MVTDRMMEALECHTQALTQLQASWESLRKALEMVDQFERDTSKAIVQVLNDMQAILAAAQEANS